MYYRDLNVEPVVHDAQYPEGYPSRYITFIEDAVRAWATSRSGHIEVHIDPELVDKWMQTQFNEVATTFLHQPMTRATQEEFRYALIHALNPSRRRVL